MKVKNYKSILLKSISIFLLSLLICLTPFTHKVNAQDKQEVLTGELLYEEITAETVKCSNYWGTSNNNAMTDVTVNGKKLTTDSNGTPVNLVPGEKVAIIMKNAIGWNNTTFYLYYNHQPYGNYTLTDYGFDMLKGEFIVPDVDFAIGINQKKLPDYFAKIENLNLNNAGGIAKKGYEPTEFQRLFRARIVGVNNLNADKDHLKIEFTSGDISAFNIWVSNGGTWVSGNGYDAGSIKPAPNLSAGTYSATYTLYYDQDGTGSEYEWEVLDSKDVTFTVTASSLSQPVLKSIFNVKNGIDVRFAEVKDATSYIFIRIANGKETIVGEVKAEDIPEKYGYKNWTDTSVKSEYGKGFAYKVIAKNDDSESDASDQLAIFRLNEPTITKLETKSNLVKVSWNKEKVHRYVLQYSADGTNWTTIETTATSRTITGLKPNTTYYFRVRGVMVQKDGTIHYSQYSTRKSVKTK